MPHLITDWVRCRPRLWAAVCVVAVLVAANLLALILAEGLGYVRVSMIFLAGVLVVAVLAGAWAAYLAALLGFISYNFYLVEPRFTFGLEAEDVIILVVFLAVAMLTGGLAGRLRDAGLRVEAQARTTRLLFEAGRDFAALGTEAAIVDRLASGLSEAVGRVVFVRAGDVTSGPIPEGRYPGLEHLDPPTSGTTKVAEGWHVRGLWSEGQPLGLAAWPAAEQAEADADQVRLVEVLTDMGASAIARARLSRAWAEVEAHARTESLRNALLSSISHDLRTPLASILASATSLKTFGGSFDEAVRVDLLDTIEEEAERLNRFVGNLLNMTRLEAGALTLRGAPFEVRESLERLVSAYERRAGRRRIVVRTEGEGLVAQGDVILFEQAMGNIIENALRFSPEEGLVEISAVRLDEMLLVEVADQGPGVPVCDIDRIFEKFYRAHNVEERQAGAGLGLSIVRGLIEAMGGLASARLRTREGGLVVGVHLPRAAQ